MTENIIHTEPISEIPEDMQAAWIEEHTFCNGPASMSIWDIKLGQPGQEIRDTIRDRILTQVDRQSFGLQHSLIWKDLAEEVNSIIASSHNT